MTTTTTQSRPTTELTNDFHKTRVLTHYDPERLIEAIHSGVATALERRAVANIRTALCPSWRSGCTCGDTLGRRP